ncbi:hypothetical protein MKX03_002612, partial [Papaver bracteatum]
ACKAAVDYLTKAHAKPHYFGDHKKGERKQIIVTKGGDQVTMFNQKTTMKSFGFVPPKDGYVVGQSSANGVDTMGERLGKRKRNNSPENLVFELDDSNSGILVNT